MEQLEEDQAPLVQDADAGKGPPGPRMDSFSARAGGEPNKRAEQKRDGAILKIKDFATFHVHGLYTGLFGLETALILKALKMAVGVGFEAFSLL